MNNKETLNKFLGTAVLATYAGNGKIIEVPQRPGFQELEYEEGDWYYRDSYAGYVRSVGHEVVWYKQKPFWSSIYGGGMLEGFTDDAKFADRTFEFLKKAMSSGEKKLSFQPRGPKQLKEGMWKYVCQWEGDILDFKGEEVIFYEETPVFTHDFRGGIINWGKNRV